MHLKKLSAFILTVFLLLQTVHVFAADNTVKVIYNGKEISFTEPKPAIVNGRTLVPIRGLFDKMGFQIEWDSETRIATLTKGSLTLYASEKGLEIKDAVTGENEPLDNDVQPQLINNYFMVPVRAVAECTGADVSWNQDTRTVTIEEEQLDGSGQSMKGSMKTSEKEYITALSSKIKEIKKAALDSNDEALQRFLGLSEKENELTSSTTEETKEKVLNLISEIEKMQPPAALSKVQDDVLQYTKLLSEFINASVSGINKEQIDEYTSQRRMISPQFGVDLSEYFKQNDVFFEGLYGADILDLI